jgi:hypothetical protein
VSDERHNEIAARLRAEAGARAPERLRADVMLQVRAEPRPRRIRPRHRRAWRPVGAVAAVACVLAALVVGLSHGGQGSPSVGAGGGSAAMRSAEGGAAAAASSGKKPAVTSTGHGETAFNDLRPTTPPARHGGTFRMALAAPAIEHRFSLLPEPIGRALRALRLDGGRGAH